MDKSGKSIELIGKVHNHCNHLYQLGFKLLALGFSDGKSFIPLDFSIHNEPGKKGTRGMKKKDLDNQFSKTRKETSPSSLRISQVACNKIIIGLSMIKSAVKITKNIKYVLADSWFICEQFISEIQQIKSEKETPIHVIGLMQTNRLVTVGKEKMLANKIPDVKQKLIKYSSKMKCYYIPLQVHYKGIKLKGFWIKMKNQNTWKLLICTDQKLSFIQAMKYYQIRWSIEVFFKECKQNLGLNSCQSKDFDAYISHITIVLMNYSTLAIRKRFDDYETLGALFRETQRAFLEATLIEKIWQLMPCIFNSILAKLGVDWELLIREFIENQSEINNAIMKAFDGLFATPQRAT